MKKLIFSVTFILAASTSLAQQAGGMGGATSPDLSTSPSGVGFGGALGSGAGPGAATPNNVPTNTMPRGNDFGAPTLEQQQERIQGQDTMDPTNPMGGSMDGLNTTPTIDTDVPGTGAPKAY